MPSVRITGYLAVNQEDLDERGDLTPDARSELLNSLLTSPRLAELDDVVVTADGVEQLDVRTLKRYGPKHALDYAILRRFKCYACGVHFTEGDWTTLVPLGPGIDINARALARAGQVYNATTVEVHWACATGEEDEGKAGGVVAQGLVAGP